MGKISKINIKDDARLFQIGDAAKLMGVTRKMILNYEAHGVLIPAAKNEKSGYRYYTADNLIQIRLIRSLQDLGLSIDEIHDYLNDTIHLKPIIARLESLRDELDINIAKLKVRITKDKTPEICWTTLQKQTMYCKKLYCGSIAERADNLRKVYIEAVRRYGINHHFQMFIESSIEDDSDCLLCVPVSPDCAGENIRIFPETRAICIYYRGAYEGISQARKSMFDFIRQKDFATYGVSRNIYMEGPPNRGNNRENYITQIAVPVKDQFDALHRG